MEGFVIGDIPVKKIKSSIWSILISVAMFTALFWGLVFLAYLAVS